MSSITFELTFERIPLKTSSSSSSDESLSLFHQISFKEYDNKKLVLNYIYDQPKMVETNEGNDSNNNITINKINLEIFEIEYSRPNIIDYPYLVDISNLFNQYLFLEPDDSSSTNGNGNIMIALASSKFILDTYMQQKTLIQDTKERVLEIFKTHSKILESNDAASNNNNNTEETLSTSEFFDHHLDAIEDKLGFYQAQLKEVYHNMTTLYNEACANEKNNFEQMEKMKSFYDDSLEIFAKTADDRLLKLGDKEEECERLQRTVEMLRSNIANLKSEFMLFKESEEKEHTMDFYTFFIIVSMVFVGCVYLIIDQAFRKKNDL